MYYCTQLTTNSNRYISLNSFVDKKVLEYLKNEGETNRGKYISFMFLYLSLFEWHH